MASLEQKWEIYAIKYAERNDRTRNDSFIFDDHAYEQHSIAVSYTHLTLPTKA